MTDLRCSWDRVSELSRLLGEAIPTRHYCLLAITRGGLVPACLLAEELGSRVVLTASTRHYTSMRERLADPQLIYFPSPLPSDDAPVLIVDDVWETGKTMSLVRDRVVQAGAIPVTAVLHFKPSANEVDLAPDYFAEKTDRWVSYPWNRPEESARG